MFVLCICIRNFNDVIESMVCEATEDVFLQLDMIEDAHRMIKESIGPPIAEDVNEYVDADADMDRASSYGDAAPAAGHQAGVYEVEHGDAEATEDDVYDWDDVQSEVSVRYSESFNDKWYALRKLIKFIFKNIEKEHIVFQRDQQGVVWIKYPDLVARDILIITTQYTIYIHSIWHIYHISFFL